MATVFRELRYALRVLFKSPGSSTVAVVTMALGIGLAASMYSILDGALLRGLPFEESHRLLHLEATHLSRNITGMEVSRHDFKDWREQQSSFEDLAGFTVGTLNLSGEGLPERYSGAWISANFLDLLGVRPILGRGFTPQDEVPGADPVVLIGHHVWQKRFGGDPGVVGRTVLANSRSTTIAGVLPQDFRFPINQDVWSPLILDTSELRRGAGRGLEVFGRLKDGVSADQAAREMKLIARRLGEEYPTTNEGVSTVVKPYAREFAGEEAVRLLAVMFGAVVFVLLIACFNVANLLLARASTRGRELAIRSALGSSRLRSFAMVFAEALLISLAGAALGVVLAHFGVRVFDAAMAQSNSPYWIQFHVSSRALAFVVGVTVVSAFIAGISPAMQASRPNLNHMLQDSTRSTSFRLGRLSRGLVVLEVAMSCALMVGAGLMVRSVIATHTHDPQFDPENVLSARVALFAEDYPERSDQLAFYDELQRRLDGKAEVLHAALATVIPTDRLGDVEFTRYERPGETYESPRNMPFARLAAITPGYFETYSVAPLAGRDVTEADREGAAAVALVNAGFARREWPGQDPVGQRINLWRGTEMEQADPDTGWVEVVGLVPNLRFADFTDGDHNQQAIYVPMAQMPRRSLWIVVKTRTDPMEFAEPLRRTVFEIDPNLPIYFVRSMDQVLQEALFSANLFGVLFSVFAGVALVLASVGLYGVMAFGVTQRIREMGVRMAFGARARDVVRLIVRQGLLTVAVGLGLGLLLGVGMSTALAFLLYQVEPQDPLTFFAVPALLLSISILACLIPGRRASATQPIEALRHE